MKSIFFVSLTIGLLLVVSCSKDKSNDRQLLLSKSYEDGLLKSEYFYSSEKKPQRTNLYSTNSGQSVLNSFRLYEYTANGQLDKVTIFNDDNVFFNAYQLQYDVNNRPTRMNDLAGDESIQFYYLFDYNTAGQMVKYSLYNAGTNKKTSEGYYTYDAKGNIAGTNRYSVNNLGTASLYDSTTYSSSGRGGFAHWQYFELLQPVALPNGDKTFYEMGFNHLFNYQVGGPPILANYEYSDKQYNGGGYLTRQQVTREVQNIGPTTVAVYELSYEYIE